MMLHKSFLFVVKSQGRSTDDDDDENPCQPSEEDFANYNLTLRIISIFVLLVISFVGVSLAVISVRVKRCGLPSVIINIGKFFGTGVILSTAFIHMFPEAMEALTDECLSEEWRDYSAFAGLFAMLSILFMQLIEFLVHHQINRLSKKESNGNHSVAVVEPNTVVPSVVVNEHNEGGHSHGFELLQERSSNEISTYLLEFGITLHSVLIGIALGTTDASSFVALFIALSFHQFFEAIALGAQIARLNKKSIIGAIVMIVLFTLSTPVGIAIGIGIRSNSYNPKATSTLLVNGVFDSVSAGILIYVSLINLIGAEMGPQCHQFFALKKRWKFVYFVSLYLGVAVMAIIGRWA